MEISGKQSVRHKKTSSTSGSSVSGGSSHHQTSTSLIVNSGRRRRFRSLSSDDQKFVDRLVSDIMRESLIIQSSRVKHVQTLPPRSRRTQRKSCRKGSERISGRSHSELRGRRTPTLFARSPLITSTSGPDSTLQNLSLSFVSLHDLPSATNFSYKDDTTNDSLDDLIANKVEEIKVRNAALQTHAEQMKRVNKSLDFLLLNPSTPIRSEKGRERFESKETSNLYEEYFMSIPVTDRNAEHGFTRTFSFVERIISSNLKQHQPDDLDIESLAVKVMKEDEGTTSTDISIRNLSHFLTSLNLSHNKLF